jgi:hypothetical protein
MQLFLQDGKHYSKSGKWLFEIKQLSAIRANEYGLPWDATSLITITNGRAAIERTIGIEDLGHSDFKDIERFMNFIGFDRESTDWVRYCPEGKKRKRIT